MVTSITIIALNCRRINFAERISRVQCIRYVPLSCQPLFSCTVRSLILMEFFQARCFAISGCCLALGLRFAGSQNEKAKGTIEHHLLEFMRMKSQQSKGRHTDQNQEVIESCLISCAMSLSVVVAGSGDLRVFSICRGKRISCFSFMRLHFQSNSNNMVLHILCSIDQSGPKVQEGWKFDIVWLLRWAINSNRIPVLVRWSADIRHIRRSWCVKLILFMLSM
jgi:hypothetical protein